MGMEIGDPIITPTTVTCTTDIKEVEFACSDLDGRLISVCINKTTGETTVTEVDGSPLTDASKPVKCTEISSIDECRQDADDISIRYTKVTCFDKTDPDATATVVWILPDGTTTTVQPANSVPCSDCNKTPLQYKTKSYLFALENTGTRYNFEYEVEITLNN